MLAKMPQKTVKSPFKNKFTIISMILLVGLGISAAYFTVPFLQSPIPTPNNIIGNTSNTTVSAPISHKNASEFNIQTTASTNNTTTTATPNNNTSKISTSQNTSKSKTNNPKTSKDTTNLSKNTKSMINNTK
jgi:hypothetical protein